MRYENSNEHKKKWKLKMSIHITHLHTVAKMRNKGLKD